MRRRPLSQLLFAAVCLALGGSFAARGRWAIAIFLFAVGVFYIVLFANLVRLLGRIRRKSSLGPDTMGDT